MQLKLIRQEIFDLME